MASVSKCSDEQSVDMPQSFALLVDVILHQAKTSQFYTTTTLCSSTRDLCRIVANCIAAVGVSAAEALVSQTGMTRLSVEILVFILMQHDASSSVVDFSGRVFLENFHSSFLVRAKAQQQGSFLFVRCSPVNVIPWIMSALCREDSDLKEVDGRCRCDLVSADVEGAAEDTLIQCLTHVIFHHQRVENTGQMVRLVVQSLRNAEPCAQINSLRRNTIDHWCDVVGRAWKEGLVSALQASPSPSLLRTTFVETSAEFLSQPSESLLLTLFGAFAGHDADFERSLLAEQRLAILDILHLSLVSLSETTRSFDPSKHSIFHRLAPLLLMRRMPFSLLRLAIQDSPSSSMCSVALMSSLGLELARRLDINADETTLQQSWLTPEERNVAAEIAGRLLPCGTSVWIGDKKSTITKECTLFQLVCCPAFTNLKACLLGECETTALKKSVRSARAALFVACNALQFADGKDEGSCVLYVARFALHCLSIETNIQAPDVVEDFIQLQTGCVEFFALCLQLSFGKQILLVSSGKLCSVQYATTQVYDATKIILTTGKVSSEWSITSSAAVHQNTAQATGNNVNNIAQVSLWRALVAASQRSEPDAASKELLPWVVAWLTESDTDHCRVQPFCVAAAMQTVLVLLLKAKTTNYLAFDHTEQVTTTSKLFRFVISVLHLSNRFPSIGLAACQAAALPLLLTLVTLCPQTPQGHLASFTSTDLLETVSVVRDLTTNDTVPDTQLIAKQILSILFPEREQ